MSSSTTTEQKVPAKKAPLTKAERRALQEKQRAAKAAARGEAPPTETTKKSAPPPQQQQHQSPAQQHQHQKGGAPKKEQAHSSSSQQQQHQQQPQRQKPSSLGSRLLGHLPETSPPRALSSLRSEAHPAIASLGLRYAAGTVDGSNRRCVAMLVALKLMVADYSCPADAAVGRDLDKKLKAAVQYLVDRRPHAVAMGAAVKHLRGVVSRFGPDISEKEAKRLFFESVDGYVQEKIVFPGRLVGDHGASKIKDGDVVATFAGGGDAVESVFRAAKRRGLRFKVVVVDERHRAKGRALLSVLHDLQVPAIYVHLRAVNFALRSSVSAVFLGADAVYSNGAVLADAGTAAVAMTASDLKVPVLFCAESYKFHANVRLDSLAWNERVTPAPEGGGEKKHTSLDLNSLHLRFDVTPPRFVTAVITEHGLIPPTSSAVLVRELELGASGPQGSTLSG